MRLRFQDDSYGAASFFLLYHLLAADDVQTLLGTLHALASQVVDFAALLLALNGLDGRVVSSIAM